MGHFIAGLKINNKGLDLDDQGHEDIIIATKSWVREHLEEIHEWSHSEKDIGWDRPFPFKFINS